MEWYKPIKFSESDKHILYYDKDGNTIPSKVYGETKDRYLIIALDPKKKIWVMKKNCEEQ